MTKEKARRNKLQEGATMKSEIELCLEYQEWCRAHRLSPISADELLHEDVTETEARWLRDFIRRWNETVRGEAK